jgi:phosphoribosylaminoimidazolecarboxamide formyltransferase/IMP cyclohydrolase
MAVRRALISVFDKTRLDRFATGLAELGVELVASGGTAAYISELGLSVKPVDALTDVPEMLGGRVKTLHPRIHGAILARRDVRADMEALEEHGIDPFDLVCVNLYPFAQVAGRKDVREEEAVEMIDIGGPAMLRAAAKNFEHVAPVCSIERYDALLLEIQATGEIDPDTRRELAAEAFAHTAAYEASIATWFGDRETFPPKLIVALERRRELSYGENPHQRAAYYVESGARRDLLSRVEQLSGKELSFNNLGDLDAARGVLGEFELPTCVVVKHGNPCGVGVASTLDDAAAKAYAADPVSAYGGVVAVNRRVDPPLAKRLAEEFVEVLIAPEYTADAVDILKQKPATRILEDRERRRATLGERDFRRVIGGFLVQDADA